jgi:hypothetical protein
MSKKAPTIHISAPVFASRLPVHRRGIAMIDLPSAPLAVDS